MTTALHEQDHVSLANPPNRTRNVLVRLVHGLDDALQLTGVVRQLKRHYPNWHIDDPRH